MLRLPRAFPAFPALFWLIAFLALPSLLLIPIAFATRGEYGDIQWTPTLENLQRLYEPGFLSERRDYLYIAARTLVLVSGTTALSLLIAYPLAFYIAALKPLARTVWMILLILPLATNLVIRAYGLQVLADPAFPLARMLVHLHLVEPGAWLFPSEPFVWIGMLSATLPLTALPLIGVVERIDWSQAEAAKDLYAGPLRTFRTAIFPQTRTGLITAAILTAIPNLGMFVIPDLLGGAKQALLGNVIQQQFSSARDYPFGAALSLALVLATLTSLTLLRLLQPKG